MDIKELEYIRDFCDSLDQFKDDLNNILLDMDKKIDIDEQAPENYVDWLWAIFHQMEAIKFSFDQFKENIDYRYYHKWEEKYPNMVSRDILSKQVEELYKENSIKNTKGQDQEGIFKDECNIPDLIEQLNYIQERLMINEKIRRHKSTKGSTN